MKLRDLAQKFNIELKDLYESAESEAIFLIAIESLLKYRRADYLMKKDENINPDKVELLEKMLDGLKEGKPIQYLLGETFFYGLPFHVNPSVLIPRPETEELVDFILATFNKHNILNQNDKASAILDIGTGSGCIAIALKKNLPDTKVYGLDIAVDSLALAQQNAILNNVSVDFKRVDILSDTSSIFHEPFSIIVSNPPYITMREKEEMHENVLANEPHRALFVSNEQPLIFYEAIADFALQNLINEGFLFFEINEYLSKETIHLLTDKGFKNIQLKKDMQGKDRMICCQFIQSSVKILDGKIV